MATHDVNLGVGNSADSGITGMFYHAPAGTELPEAGATTLGVAWSEVGAISQDGITFNSNHTFNTLKNWANEIERMLPAEEPGTVSAPILDTTEESFKTIWGADNVTITAASTSHGKVISVNVTPDDMPEAEAFLFVMKDGDDMIMIGTKKGYITELGEVAFQPNSAITWNATISADNWTIVKDDGQKTQ
jgi:hypothetical protein